MTTFFTERSKAKVSIFLNRDDLVAVSLPDEPENVVWVRRKMDLGTRNRVQDALMTLDNMNSDGTGGVMSLNLGKSNTVLMQNNIVRWEGPKFRDDNGMPIPCTPYMIENIDPDDPLVDAVLARINELNKKQEVRGEDGKVLSPNSHTGGASENGATASMRQSGRKQPVGA